MEQQTSLDRSLPDVIDQLIGALPEAETGLRADLGKIRTSALYAAPEARVVWWAAVANTMMDRVGEIVEDNGRPPEWLEPTRRIFSGQA